MYGARHFCIWRSRWRARMFSPKIARVVVSRRGRLAARSAGVPPGGAVNGVDAFKMAGDLTVLDLVLTDVVMPEMNGPALVERLHERNPALPVLFMSGHAEDLLERYGVDRVPLLRKPFTRSELLHEIRRTLNPPT